MNPGEPSARPPGLRGWLALWFGLALRVSRRDYLVSGAVLMALKYALDNAIVYGFTGRVWPPWAYLVPSLALRQSTVSATPTTAYALLGFAALPFLWVGLSMSVRRAADAGKSPWLGLGFLLPVVNYIVIAVLSLLPSQAQAHWAPPATPFRPAPEAPVAPPLDAGIAKSVQAVLVGVILGGGMTAFSVYAVHSYGGALFFASPFAMGAVSALIFNRPTLRTLRATLGVAAITVVATGVALLLFAVEGILCLAMALPIAMVLGLIGAGVAWAILRFGNARSGAAVACFFIGLPGIAGFESAVAEPTLREVMTSIEVDAPPEVVWRNVVSFSELPPPPEWAFRLGIAYPMRARIVGEGVGAVRYCEFSTGPFVEPITRWEEPRRLSFDVRSQPPSMQELSPYRHVNAPHLEGYMVSRRGEFRLTPLPGGRTRLEGSTWYTLAIFPEGYWVVPAELLLHGIHGRVLRHIKDLSEHPATAVAAR